MSELRLALLIDADNLSADVIDQAIAHLLRTYGAIHFRRAYCAPQKVIEHMELFRRHSIRPMVNVPTGKNSTDIALAVDAIDLALTERPTVVVIASSDSDYAPLAQRLREKGCRVLGIGQAGKTGGEAPLAYDEFIDLEHRKSRAVAKPVANNIPAAPRTTRPAAPAPAPAAPRARARATAPAARPVAAAVQLPADVAAPLPADVAAILAMLPGLRGGSAMQLNEVGDAMRRNDILKSRNASPSRWLKRFAAHFELAPADKPRTVRYLGPATRP